LNANTLLSPTDPYTRSRAMTLHTDLSHIVLPSIRGFGMSGAMSLGCMRLRLLMWMITPRTPSEIGAPPRFLLTASLGEVEGKRTERNIKMPSIMQIGFYRSRATPGQRALVNSHLDIIHKSTAARTRFACFYALAPRGAWLRQKSCQEIFCCRSVGMKEVCFV